MPQQVTKEEAINLYTNYINESDLSSAELISIFNTLYLYRKPGYKHDLDIINTAYIRAEPMPIQIQNPVTVKPYRATYVDGNAIGYPTRKLILRAYTAEDAVTQFKVIAGANDYRLQTIEPAPEADL